MLSPTARVGCGPDRNGVLEMEIGDAGQVLEADTDDRAIVWPLDDGERFVNHVEVLHIEATSKQASRVETAMYFATEPKPGQLSVIGRSLSTVFGTWMACSG